MMSARAKLAALIYRDEDHVDALVADFRRVAEARGARVGGLAQTPCESSIFVTHIESGRRLDLMQDLGACAEGCRLDTAALAEAAGLLAQSLESRPDLLLVSRYGRIEAEGGGYLATIGAAAVEAVPTLVCVGAKYAEHWREFSGGLAESLPLTLAALTGWWDEAARDDA
jgi:hypothetical protein